MSAENTSTVDAGDGVGATETKNNKFRWFRRFFESDKVRRGFLIVMALFPILSAFFFLDYSAPIVIGMSVAVVWMTILATIHYLKNNESIQKFLTAPVIVASLFIGLGVALALLPTLLSASGISSPLMGMLFDLVGPGQNGTVVLLATISGAQLFVIGGTLLAGFTAVFHLIHFFSHQRELTHPTIGNAKSFYKKWSLTSFGERFIVGALITISVLAVLLNFFPFFEQMRMSITAFVLAPIVIVMAAGIHFYWIFFQRRGNTREEIAEGEAAEKVKIDGLKTDLNTYYEETKGNVWGESSAQLPQKIRELYRDLQGRVGALERLAGSHPLDETRVKTAIRDLTPIVNEISLRMRAVKMLLGNTQNEAVQAVVTEILALHTQIVSVGATLLSKNEDGALDEVLDDLSMAVRLLKGVKFSRNNDILLENTRIHQLFQSPAQPYRARIFSDAKSMAQVGVHAGGGMTPGTGTGTSPLLVAPPPQ